LRDFGAGWLCTYGGPPPCSLRASFTDDDTWTGTLRMNFDGSCLDCTAPLRLVTGSA